MGLSAITRAELECGAARLEAPEREQEALEKILAPFDEYDFDGRRCARAYGVTRAALEREARTIGGMDLLIAAHALALSAVLVTRNTKHFSRVPGLSCVDWST